MIEVGENTIIKTALPGLPNAFGIVFVDKGKRRLRTFDAGTAAMKQVWLTKFTQLQAEYTKAVQARRTLPGQ